MATETFTTTVFKCDRCTSEHTFPQGSVPSEWLMLNGQSRTGGPAFGHTYKAELCGECTKQFVAWMTGLDSK